MKSIDKILQWYPEIKDTSWGNDVSPSAGFYKDKDGNELRIFYDDSKYPECEDRFCASVWIDCDLKESYSSNNLNDVLMYFARYKSKYNF